MAQMQHTPAPPSLEAAIIVLFCLVDDAYAPLNPRGDRYGALKKLSDSEVLALALFQQLRGVESERSFLRDAARFFSHLFPGVVNLAPSSFHRRVRKLRRFLEPLRRSVVPELLGDPETLVVESTLLSAASLAPAPGLAVGGVRGGRSGEVGQLLGLWGEAPHALLDQPLARFLRAHRGQRG